MGSFSKWLGEGAKVIRNKMGAKVIRSKIRKSLKSLFAPYGLQSDQAKPWSCKSRSWKICGALQEVTSATILLSEVASRFTKLSGGVGGHINHFSGGFAAKPRSI